MNCPNCKRSLGCSCQLRNDPVTKAVIGCTGCLQGTNVKSTSTKPQRTWPPKKLGPAVINKQINPRPPVVNRVYWTRSK